MHKNFVALPKPLHGIANVVVKVARFFRDDLVPAVKEIASVVGPALIGFLRDARPHVEEFGEIFLSIGREVLPIVLEAIRTLAAAWLQLFEAVIRPVALPLLAKVGQFLLEHKPLIVGVAAVILLLTNPWLLVVAAIILVLAKWDEIKAMLTQTIPAAINSVITKIREIPVLGTIFETTFNSIRIIVETVFALVKNNIETAINAIRAIISIVLALIRGDFGAAWEGIKQLVSVVLRGILANVGIILGGLKALIFNQINGALGALGELIPLAGAGAFALGRAILQGIKDGINASLFLVRGAFNGLISLFERGINYIIGKWNDLEFKVSGPAGIGSATIGTPNLPRVSIPRLAGGAFIPPGVVTPAILHGGKHGEVVAPLDRAMMGTTVVFQRGAFEGMMQSLISTASPTELEQAGEIFEAVLRKRLA
jgi:phage-related protein